jgi:hypothetical protein
MKTVILSLLILTSSMVYAQNSDVAAAVENLRKAMLDADKAALDKLAHAKLSYGHSSGKIEDKAAFINALVSGESDFTELAFDDQTIEVIGDMALVRHKLTGKTHDKGKQPGTVAIGVLLVWYKEGNSWKLTARQAFKL